MKTCETCKFWDGHNNPRTKEILWDTPKDTYACLRIPFIENWKARSDTAYVVDCSTYQADLYSTKDFGCTLHSEKE